MTAAAFSGTIGDIDSQSGLVGNFLENDVIVYVFHPNPTPDYYDNNIYGQLPFDEVVKNGLSALDNLSHGLPT